MDLNGAAALSSFRANGVKYSLRLIMRQDPHEPVAQLIGFGHFSSACRLASLGLDPQPVA
jgi:hypothetical protein